jgi:hypothetical protein
MTAETNSVRSGHEQCNVLARVPEVAEVNLEDLRNGLAAEERGSPDRSGFPSRLVGEGRRGVTSGKSQMFASFLRYVSRENLRCEFGKSTPMAQKTTNPNAAAVNIALHRKVGSGASSPLSKVVKIAPRTTLTMAAH